MTLAGSFIALLVLRSILHLIGSLNWNYKNNTLDLGREKFMLEGVSVSIPVELEPLCTFYFPIQLCSEQLGRKSE